MGLHSLRLTVFFILSFLVANGVEVIFVYVFSFDFLFKKHFILVNYFVCLLAFLVLVLYNTKVSFRVLLFILLCSMFFAFVTLRDLLVFSSYELIMTLELYSILIMAAVMAEYEKRYQFDAYGFIFKVISFLSLVLVIKIFLTYEGSVRDLVSFSEIKRLTHLGFVNAFAYVCAYGVLCAAMSWWRSDFILKKSKSQAFRYLCLLFFPLLYLLISKSKGGIAVVLLGGMVLYFRLRTLAFFSSLLATIGLLASTTFSTDLFLRFMMIGRDASKSEVAEKVASMLANRVGASDLFHSPLTFFSQNPFGVGLGRVMSKEYLVLGKDVIVKNHSLLMVLIESYGLLCVILFGVIFLFTSINLKHRFILGICMIAVPIIVRNEPNTYYVIPLLLMASSITLKKHNHYDRHHRDFLGTGQSNLMNKSV